MKKKSLIVAVAASISLVACGESPSTQPTTAPVAESSESVKETTVPETSTVAEKTVAEEFEEIVAVDNEFCTIKLTGIDPDDMWGYTIKAYLENKSPDKTYMFSIRDASINGVKSEPGFVKEIAPTKKGNGEISFSDNLKDYGITDYTDIRLSFYVYDSNDWTSDPVAEETVHVYPHGEENASKFIRPAADGDIIMVDNDKVTAIVTGFENDEIWGYTANLYLVNKTDTSVMFSVDECSINDFMLDPLFAKSVPAGESAFSSMSWSNDSLAENGIETIENIQFRLKAYDENNITGEDFFNDIVTLTP